MKVKFYNIFNVFLENKYLKNCNAVIEIPVLSNIEMFSLPKDSYDIDIDEIELDDMKEYIIQLSVSNTGTKPSMEKYNKFL